MADFPGSSTATPSPRRGAAACSFGAVGQRARQRQRHRRAEGFAGAVARRTEGPNDLSALRLDGAWLLLRAVKAQGWEPGRDITIITQRRKSRGAALVANKIDAHADFVPFADLFPWRGFARKIYDGPQADAPTFHGALADADYADK